MQDKNIKKKYICLIAVLLNFIGMENVDKIDVLFKFVISNLKRHIYVLCTLCLWNVNTNFQCFFF